MSRLRTNTRPVTGNCQPEAQRGLDKRLTPVRRDYENYEITVQEAASERVQAATLHDIRKRVAEPPDPVDYDATPEAVAAWEAEHGKRWPGRRKS